ncbi:MULTISPECIES: bifunctional UDP-N-acetylglucosamine diphosphorylase/glucosamine-1-phosphate N-acetyltransferase GlmU [Shouchella]|uniref:Bifunctional protein GlmU n=3 Tax=Bacillaceae TaxID=186817 RepID=A0A060LZF7_9BACI|nr:MULTISPECIES: bifunctional UDP-N-acetylglucosamine diphosphorylase/glucosamine-1-phosphate N-acetyltransferase GlmU [Bacillaceae]RQW18091.1 bifunctional UDP-N-acetylglucosamine diphosphorylase/glucosamine-1-phosphate N-acetyltransferase GlmU [Bacillus sp. C1-1]AIC96601.1 UDP-N-acetylglucosamine pyrophosphorylase [Shouchella lehensis G1]KQL51628.1 bifunctional N-acetylglucosamine-1-phosphate uridyltransferase/glucosamine-1-phosphate acetyltransferase [Alkalicoccobacillus plakortidis]MBG978239
MSGRYAIVLAAGQGTRMKSKLYKVLHPVCGKPMVEHVVDQAKAVGFDDIAVVVGHGAEQVKEAIPTGASFVLQNEQLGTGHAVRCAEPLLKGKNGTTVVLCGDTPLITAETLKTLIAYHEQEAAKATILTAYADNPHGYGRVIRGSNGEVDKIVEQKDASSEELLVNEINTGIYCFDNNTLFDVLQMVTNDNNQGEYYLPDVIGLLNKKEEKVCAYVTPTMEETIGVNDRVALAQAEKAMQARINTYWMTQGVTFIDPNTTYISVDATIAQDTTLFPNVSIKGNTTIGEDCIIESGSEIHHSVIEKGVHIRSSYIYNSYVHEGAAIGPFAHIRPDSTVGKEVKVGNFVELKKASINDRSKVSHLTYIGDADIGKDVNVGCGVVTVNYDGTNKHQTTVHDGAFIGSGSNLVAPVEIGKHAFVAAGSTITNHVNDYSLAIARARQVDKTNYIKKDQ